jgi:glycosyltransferase involved in cell wall biosynthesis
MERHMMDLAASIQSIGWRACGIVPAAASLDPMAAFFQRRDLETYRYSPITSKPAQMLPLNWSRLVGLFRTIRPDVVHFHRALSRFGKWSILAARAAAIPVIVTTDHDLPAQIGRSNLDRLSDRLLDAVIVASEHNRQAQMLQLGRPEALVRRVYCGIDLGSFQQRDQASVRAARALFGLPLGAPVIGVVARLVDSKRIFDLIAAAATLRDSSAPDIHVLISGEGPAREALEAQAASLNLADRVRFLGYYPDVAAVMRSLDVFVLPSSWEGFGLVAAEAMAVGVPVVATQVGGLSEVVANGAGLLVPVGDVSAIATAVSGCLNDPDLRSRLCRAGRRRVEVHFSSDAMARNVSSIYKDLLARG